MFSCKNNLQVLPLLTCFTLTGHSNRHRSFSTNIYNSWTYYPVLKSQYPYGSRDQIFFAILLSYACYMPPYLLNLDSITQITLSGH